MRVGSVGGGVIGAAVSGGGGGVIGAFSGCVSGPPGGVAKGSPNVAPISGGTGVEPSIGVGGAISLPVAPRGVGGVGAVSGGAPDKVLQQT